MKKKKLELLLFSIQHFHYYLEPFSVFSSFPALLKLPHEPSALATVPGTCPRLLAPLSVPILIGISWLVKRQKMHANKAGLELEKLQFSY